MTAATAVAVVADVAVSTAVTGAGLSVTVTRIFLCSLCCTAAEADCCGVVGVDGAVVLMFGGGGNDVILVAVLRSIECVGVMGCLCAEICAADLIWADLIWVEACC